MEKLEKLEIPTIEFSKVTMLAGGTSGCETGGEQIETPTGQNGGYGKDNNPGGNPDDFQGD